MIYLALKLKLNAIAKFRNIIQFSIASEMGRGIVITKYSSFNHKDFCVLSLKGQ